MSTLDLAPTVGQLAAAGAAGDMPAPASMTTLDTFLTLGFTTLEDLIVWAMFLDEPIRKNRVRTSPDYEFDHHLETTWNGLTVRAFYLQPAPAVSA